MTRQGKVRAMNIFREFHGALSASIIPLLPPGLDLSRVTVEPPRETAHGDLATNAAMVLAKAVGMAPRALAEMLLPALEKLPGVTAVEIAGPGFINFRLDSAAWTNILASITHAPKKFGSSDVGGGASVNLEYVSANPTGPLTAGHARGAVFGDVLANVLIKAGFRVNKEYYLNDYGAQVGKLGQTAMLRYREALGEAIGEIPAGLYPGDYMKEVAQAMVARHGDKLLNDDAAVQQFAVDYLVGEIKKDLHDMGVHHDEFVSEAEIVAGGEVDKALDHLTKLGLIYEGVLEAPKGKQPEDWEPRPQTLFRSSDFGDDVDRPLKKSDGTTTYFANDIAHYFLQYRKGYPTLINIVGADHGGYVKRAQAAVKAMSEGKAAIDLPLMQIVHMFVNGQPMRMSKRAGTFVTLRDVMDMVGPDAIRFIMMTRSNDQTLEFDIAKVKEASKDNPVFYVQYAHARCASVLRHAADMFPDFDVTKADLSSLADPAEIAVIKQLALWPRVVEQAATAHEPHKVAFFVMEVAASFHALWNKGKDNAHLRFLVADDPAGSLARLALVAAVKTTIASALNVMGVAPVEEMKSDSIEGEAA